MLNLATRENVLKNALNSQVGKQSSKLKQVDSLINKCSWFYFRFKGKTIV